MEIVKAKISEANELLREAMEQNFDSVLLVGFRDTDSTYRLLCSATKNRLEHQGILFELLMHVYRAGETVPDPSKD